MFTIDGKFRTSIIVDPKNGRYAAHDGGGDETRREARELRRANDGTAWWLDADLPAGPYDGPEMLGISERCILGFTGATPTFPSLYNNFKRIVQTDDYVMIEIEMVHDARIVRMDSEHAPAGMRRWLGDSIGRWDGDTLVVDTTNFHPQSGVRGGGDKMHVVERFTKLADGDLLYRFTVDDPSIWTAPWTGEYVWRASDERVSSTPATKATTRWATSCVARGCSRGRRSRSAPPVGGAPVGDVNDIHSRVNRSAGS